MSQQKPHFYQRITKTLRVFLLLIVGFIITACSESTPTNNTLIRVATAPGDFYDLFHEYIGPELTKDGYEVNLKVITDIVVPNVAVDEGSLEVNLFQHKPYMDEFNKTRKGNLIPLVQVPTAPYGIYPGKLDSTEQIYQGASIAIPSNVTNFSRGLWILEGLGWITIDKNVKDRFHLNRNDIASNPYNLDIKEIEAAQIIRAQSEVDYAIINGKYALEAGIHFTDALYVEPSKYFVNWIVINAKNQNTHWALKIIEIVNSEGFKDYTNEHFKGYDLPLAWSQESL